jgi:predicted nucleic acid-binding protein
MNQSPSAELLVCDSSFVGAVAQRHTHPERIAHWDETIVQRIDRARLAISVFTLAEARVGFLVGEFGPKRIDREERRLRAFAQLPLDEQILAEWVRLRAAVRGLGLTMSDNDLWIAATASSYDAALVTCDRDQARIAHLLHDVVFLPRTLGTRSM